MLTEGVTVALLVTSTAVEAFPLVKNPAPRRVAPPGIGIGRLKSVPWMGVGIGALLTVRVKLPSNFPLSGLKLTVSPLLTGVVRLGDPLLAHVPV